MANFPTAEFLGNEEGLVPGKPADAAETESFTKCPECGGVIDCEDLTVVLAHLRPLPHTVQDQ
jgi:hypothetical protein